MEAVAIFTWVLAFISIFGTWIVGSGYKLGWLIAFGTQILWAFYFVGTDQWGLLFQSAVFAILFMRNFFLMDVYTKQHVCKEDEE